MSKNDIHVSTKSLFLESRCDTYALLTKCDVKMAGILAKFFFAFL